MMHVGTVFLYLAFASSFILFVICILSVAREKEYGFTENLFYVSGFFITMALALLFAAFVRDRFDIGYVYNYSSRALPLYYKIAGTWAGQEGTLLLWAFFLFVSGSFVLKHRDSHAGIVLSIIALTQALILFILLLHSPFEYIWNLYKNISPGMPSDGSGLNPLLQDPWMVLHPPVLFIGYAAATVPYAYAIAALIRDDYSTWISRSYKWVVFCSVSLGIGIFLGALWAYKVLGWGGYWGWDPVENSSLIPWLTVTALMHGMMMQKRKNSLVKTNVFLAIITLVLVFYGTFLTRSGILSDFSVHSFGDLGMKAYLILYILIFLFPGVALLIIRRRSAAGDVLPPDFFSAGNIFVYGLIMLLLYAFFILTGTSMPILSGIFLENASAVGERFYINISKPFGIAILLALSFAGIGRSGQKKRYARLIAVVACAVFSGVIINLFQAQYIYAYIFSMLGFFIIFLNIAEMASAGIFTASRIAHIGIGLMVIGFVSSNMHSYSVQKELLRDKETDINDNISLTFLGEKETSLELSYKKNGNENIIQTPYYFSEKTNSLIREPYVDYGLLRDIYISPVEYKDGLSRGRHVLSRGAEKNIEGIKIKFEGFDADMGKMMPGNAKLSARLKVNAGGRDYTLSPGLLIKDDTNRENLDVVVPHVNRKISLVDFDISSKEILIYVEPEMRGAELKESVLLDISFKRLVWLVWAGAGLIAIGGMYALLKRKNTKIG